MTEIKINSRIHGDLLRDAHVGDLVTIEVVGRISKVEADMVDISDMSGYDALPGDITTTVLITKIKKTWAEELHEELGQEA